MSLETYASGNRIAEIDGIKVIFSRLSGNVRKSKHPIWHMECEDTKKARRLAKGWAFKCKLGATVLQ